MGRAESPRDLQDGTNIVSQVDKSLRYGTHLPALWLFSERVQKRDNGLCLPFCVGESCLPALALLADTSVPPCLSLVPLKLLHWCWSSEGVSLSKSMCGFFKRNFLGFQKFLPPFQSLLVFAARSCGTGTLLWGAWCWTGTLCS